MPRARSSSTELLRAFAASVAPAYMLDAQRRITYCNQACLDWLGVPFDKIRHARCDYHSSSEVQPTLSLAAGLSPPPEVFTGSESLAVVTARGAASSSELKRRQARFTPLVSEQGEVFAILALVAAEDLGEAESASHGSTLTLSLAGVPLLGGYGQAALEDDWQKIGSQTLHDSVGQLRARYAQRFYSQRLVAQSPAMRQVARQISVAKGCDASVLIRGPVGSPREDVARAIHYNQSTKEPGPLIPLACRLLGEDLIRSTLRTLSSSDVVETVGSGSTLLLRDVEYLPSDIRRELAARIDDRSLTYRVMSTTQPLRGSSLSLDSPGADQVGETSELATLLGDVTIELPPLAQRKEDVPLIVQALIEELNAEGGRQVGGCSPEAMEILCQYHWSGDVDSLVEVIHQAWHSATSPTIALPDIPSHISMNLQAISRPIRKPQPIELQSFLQQMERELIERALRGSKGNKAKAARLLGMTRPRLYRRLVQLGLDQES